MMMEQKTVTNSAVIRGLCAMTKTLNQQCMLAQACPPMIHEGGLGWVSMHIQAQVFLRLLHAGFFSGKYIWF